MEELSNSQVDKLGERLKQEVIEDKDLVLLNAFRKSFEVAHIAVKAAIEEQLGLAPTGRPEKSRGAIVDKLRRESIRLSQMQDIAGCRLIVRSIAEQDCTVVAICDLFKEVKVLDRRINASHGYRAVHIIAYKYGKPVEVQVRTGLQNLWATFSEKMADRIDPRIKYGGGDASYQAILGEASQLIASFETSDGLVHADLMKRLHMLREGTAEEFLLSPPEDKWLDRELQRVLKALDEVNPRVETFLSRLFSLLEQTGMFNDISDTV